MARKQVIAASTAASLFALALATPVVAQAKPPRGVWAKVQGVSSSELPQVQPTPNIGVKTVALISSGDRANNGYVFGGIPDGMGAKLSDKGNEFTVYTNHEIAAGLGVPRLHGANGAYVSALTFNKLTGEAVAGKDLINKVNYFDYNTKQYAAAPVAPSGALANTHTLAFSRFCSGTLTDPGMLISGEGSKQVGFDGQLWLAGEESGDEGRVFGVDIATGEAWQLPKLGLWSVENAIPLKTDSNTTVVVGGEDATPGELWIYVGQKSKTGSAVEKAGLTNGTNYVLSVPGISTDKQFRTTHGKGKPVAAQLSSPIDWTLNGKAQNAAAVAQGGLGFTRVEDGAWDPNNPNTFYFLTTEGGDTSVAPFAASTVTRDGGGLWQLKFKDVSNPAAGMTLTLLLDGSEAPYLSKPDNMTIDSSGNLLIQEDPGNNARNARIVAYRLKDGKMAVLTHYDVAQYGHGGEYSTTRTIGVGSRAADEETSGIITADAIYGKGTFIFNSQSHDKGTLLSSMVKDGVIEGGQILLLKVSDWNKVYCS